MPYTNKSRWQQRIEDADDYYKEWEKLFQCDFLEKCWRGFQYKNVTDYSLYRPYTLNMIYSTIKIKLAGILFQVPEFLITPFPGKMDWNQELATRVALKKQDTLNQVIRNRNSNFTKNLKLSALDSFFRFGITEVGYAADWQNPKKRDVITKAYYNSDLQDDANSKIDEDPEIPESEWLYYKRIPAKRFRVSTSDDPFLNNCNWCGYYSFMLKTTLEKTKGIKFPKDYISNNYSYDYKSVLTSLGNNNDPEVIRAVANGQICKVWNIWDNRTKIKSLILGDCFETLWEDEFERLPFSELKWDDDIDGWYPIPPVWQWLSAQDEINQSREQMRNYRRRFIRKFWVRKGMIDDDEMTKFSSGKDGEVIMVKGDGNAVIGALSNPEIGISIEAGLSSAMNDMNLITATSSNAREQSDRTTATESKIIDMRSQIRESAEQMDFSEFICNVGREALLQICERFSEGMYVKMTTDPGNLLEEIQSDKVTYEYITAQDLNDGWDFDIELAVTNAVPARMIEEETKFMKFITIMTQFPQLALSPKLIRETAYRVGYRNEAIIKEMQQAAIMRMMAQATALQGQQSNGSPENASMEQNAQPSPVEETNRQLAQQVQ